MNDLCVERNMALSSIVQISKPASTPCARTSVKQERWSGRRRWLLGWGNKWFYMWIERNNLTTFVSKCLGRPNPRPLPCEGRGAAIRRFASNDYSIGPPFPRREGGWGVRSDYGLRQ